jgi:hypothetical protein
VNARRALRWLRDRLVVTAMAGRLSVRVGRRFVTAADAADVDAWLLGQELPSRVALRESGPARLAALGGDVA